MDDSRPRCAHGAVYPMEHCTVCLGVAFASCEARLARLRAEVEKLRAAREDWRTVEREMPPVNRSVLVYRPDNRGEYMAYWNGKQWICWVRNGPFDWTPSHWMPMPECPAAKAGEERTEVEILKTAADDAWQASREMHEAEMDALRADVVWAVRNCCEEFDETIMWQTGSEALGEANFDGTDASLLSAVRRAREDQS